MTATVNGLALRRALGRERWAVPEQFGPDGWRMLHKDGDGAVIVTTAGHPVVDSPLGDIEWTHASMTRRNRLPSYADLVLLKAAVWGSTGWAMQVFAPEDQHINIHEYALHLWGPADGSRPPCIPDFGVWGTI